MLHVMMKSINESSPEIPDTPTSTTTNENDTHDSDQFAATSKNTWCITYNLYMDNLSDEDDDEAIVSTIYDDLNNGQVFDWDNEIQNFITLLKLSPSFKPKIYKNQVPQKKIFSQFKNIPSKYRSNHDYSSL
jgi:hypothetical protein